MMLREVKSTWDGKYPSFMEKQTALSSFALGYYQQRYIKPSFKEEYDELNEGQQLIYLSILSGINILITGGGGVGKSHLIRFLSRYVPHIVLTASTGIAGINIDGDTIDSLMGFSPDPHKNRQPMSSEIKDRLLALKILLIDEVSMVRIDRLEAIDERLRQVKGNSLPFGGVQVILAGDFGQLPPVVDERSEEGKRFLAMYGKKLFAFESDVYKRANFVPFVLTEYVRNGDPMQRRILRNMRMGHGLPEAVRFINENAKGQVSAGSIRICKTNAQVKKLNEAYFEELPGEEHLFEAQVKDDFPLEDLVVERELRLKMNCRVILCVNSSEGGYRNGDLGVVTGMFKEGLEVKLDRGPKVLVQPHTWRHNGYEKNKDGELAPVEKGSVSQFPIRIGVAITGHKSQGMTLDSAIVDLSGGFNPPGLTYVVISRVTSFDRLKMVKKLTIKDIAFSQVAVDFTRKVSEEALARRGRDRLMLPKSV